jgi:hypothetical protein
MKQLVGERPHHPFSGVRLPALGSSKRTGILHPPADISTQKCAHPEAGVRSTQYQHHSAEFTPVDKGQTETCEATGLRATIWTTRLPALQFSRTPAPS